MPEQAPIVINNNFSKFKNDFKVDTGFEAKDRMDLYIQYVNARCNDYTAQVVNGLTHQLINKLNFIPGEIRLQIAEMLSDHEVIKQLLKGKS